MSELLGSSAVQIGRVIGFLHCYFKIHLLRYVQLLPYRCFPASKMSFVSSLCIYVFFFLNCTLMLFYWDFRKEQRLMHAINPPCFIRSQSDVLYLFSSYTSLKVIHSLYSFNGLSITISLKSLKIINVLISFWIMQILQNALTLISPFPSYFGLIS